MRLHEGDMGEPLWVCRDCKSLWGGFDNQDKCVCGGDDWFKYVPCKEWNRNEEEARDE